MRSLKLRRFEAFLIVFLLLLVTSPCFAWAGINDGLVAYYPLNGNANDASGNGYNGIIYGALPSEDRFGDVNSSLFFDGNDKIVVDAFRNHTWGEGLTVCVWFKRTGQWYNYQGIINNGYYTYGSWEIRMRREGDGTRIGCGVSTEVSPEPWDYDGSPSKPCEEGSCVSQNEWHHAVMTYNGNELLFYLDGIAQQKNPDYPQPNDIGAIIPKNTPLTIGQSGVGTSVEYFYGLIDDIRIYNRALTESEVLQHYYQDYQVKIAFIKDNDIWITDELGNSPINLTNSPSIVKLEPKFSPDGTKIAYYSSESGRYELWMMNSDGSNIRQMTDNDTPYPAYGDHGPAWLPNGQTLYFGSGAPGDCETWKINLDGTGLQQLTEIPGYSTTAPDISHDGTMITFPRALEGNGYTNRLYVANIDYTNPVEIQPNYAPHGPKFSPDDTKIAYTAALPNRSIRIINSDGSGDYIVLAGASLGFAEWHPNGNRLLIGQNGNLYWINTDGTNQTLVTTGERATVGIVSSCTTIEICDNVDNDCDGLIDEDFDIGATCIVGVGACQASGTKICSIDGLGTICDAIEGTPSMEVCDSIDNDCDGSTDEDLRTTTCGLGVCEHTIDNCVAGIPQTCDPFEGASIETCDNLDNDCDGIVDENLTQPTTCGVGVCSGNTGFETCTAGVWGDDTCDPLAGAIPEICDGLDNNCDGSVPEDEADADTDGFRICQNDCNDADAAINPDAAEICNDGIDNDCSGEDAVTPSINGEAISGTAVPLPVTNALATVSFEFTDPNMGDTHAVTINWGDESIAEITLAESVRVVEETHLYAQAGVYTVAFTVDDGYCGTDSAEYRYVVVYDPDGGFVTGGGWINSPEGAYTADPSLTGKATFGFVSKYKKGATVPTGETQFQFKVANLNFHSDTYQWLVIAGSKAQYKGTGTINGQGNYGFMLTAIDGDLKGGDPDKFRIKIWDKDNNDEIVYDNQLNDSEDADPTTEIGGGSIVIHKK